MLYTPYFLLLLTILLNYGQRLRQFRWLTFVLSIILAYFVNLVDLVALVPVSLLLLFAALATGQLHLHRYIGKSLTKSISLILLLLVSVSMGMHLWPGFNNIIYLDNVKASSDSLPYSLWLNFDKGIVGVILFTAFSSLSNKTRHQWISTLQYAGLGGLLACTLIIPISIIMGVNALALKLPNWFLVWSLSNLLITCLSEEMVFRGIIQTQISAALEKYRYAGVFSVAVTALLFGIAHFSGGISFIALATAAGLVYGWVFYKAKHIESSILCHYFLNLCHLLVATYPAKI